MRRGLQVFITVAAVCCLLSGCALWMDGSRYSVTPHLEENASPEKETVEISSYIELRESLAELVENGRTSEIIYVSGFDEQQLEGYMNIAIQYLLEGHAIGAYALDSIEYEIGTSAGQKAIAVEISYNHNRGEIMHVKKTTHMKDANNLIIKALENCEAGIVLQVDQYQTTDFPLMIQNYVEENPNLCMEVPQVAVSLYPDSGLERVIELSFTYQTNRDTLRSMQSMVRPVFASAELYVSGDADRWEKYSQLFSFLMERYDYKIETSITPAYSLLRHGVGDSKAFALVYAAMCRQAELDCQVVSGTRGGEPWNWNVLHLDGVYYYVDLLRCDEEGSFTAKMEAEMEGYVWDYSAYVSDPIPEEDV